MALVKQIQEANSHSWVTFTIENHIVTNPSEILLLGDFNNWQRDNSAHQMKKEGDVYKKRIKLENGKRYEFRYLSNNHEWFNDTAADDYVPSPYEGIQNCVVDLSSIAVKKKKSTKKSTKKAKKDDLKKIEGIGPKIAGILTEKGISTFKKLSEASVTVLESILKEAGPRYAMHKPGSWPQQAQLAYEGKWEELDELQELLDGGR